MNVISLEDLKKNPPQSPAIHWFDRPTNKFVTFTYGQFISGAISASNAIKSVLSQRNISRRVVVAVVGAHHPFVLPAILGTIDSGNVFCCLETDVTEVMVQNLRVDVCLTVQKTFFDFLEGGRTTVFEDFVVELLIHSHLAVEQKPMSSNIFYCIATSGTTGDPKVVKVPVECIWPNIEHLKKTFQLHKDDVIYISAPPTFDPFIVDIFLALSVGASILITDNQLRLCRQELLVHLFPPTSVPHCPTFMQMTPSLFGQWSLADIQSKVLSPNSRLRTLVLGGESFPEMSQVKQWQDWQSTSKKRVFNIYGITEISCWALIHEIEGNEVEAPLGGPIDVVNFEVAGNSVGELILKSSDRKCIVNDEDALFLNENFEVRRSTGDIVEQDDGRLFYRNRLAGAFVKKFGQRISLHKIERVFELHRKIRKACCVFHNQQIILFYTTHDGECDELQLRAEVKKSLANHECPDKMVLVGQFPLSAHGKISKKNLLDLVIESKNPKNSTPATLLLEAIKDLCGEEVHLGDFQADLKTTKRQKTPMLTSFQALGGSSMKAIQIVTKIQDAGYQCPELIGLLLNNEMVVADIVAYLETCPLQDIVTEVHANDCQSHKFTFKLVYQYNLLKCIDASPTIIQYRNDHTPLVVVGSHSHRLVGLNSKSGAVLSEFELNERIEGQATQFQNACALVGCYAGYLYCLDLLAGTVRWRFASGHMIKSRPLVTPVSTIVFGNYSEDKNLHCLDEAGNLVWSETVGRKGIRAAPLSVPNNCCFVCSIDGTYSMVCAKSGATVWRGKVESPIFADPVYLQLHKLILMAEVAGTVHCIDLNGKKIWHFAASGNIFSSFELFDTETSTINIIFGCHDKHLYSLDFDVSTTNVSLKWRLPFDSPIYASPRAFEKSLIICLTNGTILLLDRNTGERLSGFAAKGEVFSTPAIWNRKVFVGCRDNYLYCLTCGLLNTEIEDEQ